MSAVLQSGSISFWKVNLDSDFNIERVKAAPWDDINFRF